MSAADDPALAEFLARLDQARGVAKAAQARHAGGPEWLVREYDRLLANLVTLEETARAGRLPRPSRGQVPPGTGLGIGKALGEWCDDDDTFAAMARVEDFYRSSM